MSRSAQTIRLASVTAVVVAVMSWFARPALADPGDLDPTFSGDGSAFVAFGAGSSYGQAMTLQPDGRILLAGVAHPSMGNFGVVRLKPNGYLDPTFGGGDGRVTTDFGGNDWAWAVTVQEDGKILVAGTRGFSPGRMAVARYSPGGALDHSFSGDGKRIVPVGDSVGATGVAVLPSGAIVLVGDASTPTGRSSGKMSVVKLRPDGSLDPGFGTGRRRLIGPPESSVGVANGVAVDTKGRLVVVGFVGKPCATNLVAVRLRADGSLDPAFSADGKWTLDLGKTDAGVGVAVDQQRRVVIGGFSGSCPHVDGERMLVVRLTANGTPDPAFSDDGVVRTDFGSGGDAADGVTIQANGRIVAVGTTRTFTAGGDTRIAIARYLPGGGLDGAFGNGDGKVELNPGGDLDRADDVAVQPDGNIVLGGNGADPSRFYAARLEG